MNITRVNKLTAKLQTMITVGCNDGIMIYDIKSSKILCENTNINVKKIIHNKSGITNVLDCEGNIFTNIQNQLVKLLPQFINQHKIKNLQIDSAMSFVAINEHGNILSSDAVVICGGDIIQIEYNLQTMGFYPIKYSEHLYMLSLSEDSKDIIFDCCKILICESYRKNSKHRIVSYLDNFGYLKIYLSQDDNKSYVFVEEIKDINDFYTGIDSKIFYLRDGDIIEYFNDGISSKRQKLKICEYVTKFYSFDNIIVYIDSNGNAGILTEYNQNTTPCSDYSLEKINFLNTQFVDLLIQKNIGSDRSYDYSVLLLSQGNILYIYEYKSTLEEYPREFLKMTNHKTIKMNSPLYFHEPRCSKIKSSLQ